MSQERGQVNQWLEVESQNYSPHVFTICFEKLVKRMRNMGEPDEAKVADAKEKVSGILEALSSKTICVC